MPWKFFIFVEEYACLLQHTNGCWHFENVAEVMITFEDSLDKDHIRWSWQLEDSGVWQKNVGRQNASCPKKWDWNWFCQFSQSEIIVFSKYTKKIFAGSNDSRKTLNHAAITKCPIERVKPGGVGKICGSLDKLNYNLLEADPIPSHTIPPSQTKLTKFLWNQMEVVRNRSCHKVSKYGTEECSANWKN